MKRVIVVALLLFLCSPLSAQDQIHRKYYETGELKAESELENGTGQVRTYYKSGALKSVRNYVDYEKQGLQQDFYESGALKGEGVVKDGTGTDKTYYEDGTLKSITHYVHYEKEGEYKIFNKDGSLKVEGVHDDYSKKQKLQEILEKNQQELQKKNGPYYQYYPSGAVMIEGKLKDGKVEGVQKYFEEDGTLKGMVEYKDGEKIKEREYFKNGKVSVERVFEGGKLKTVKKYDEKGKLLSTDKF